MTYIGTVSKGKVTLPPDAKLPDGTKVRVETVEQTSTSDTDGRVLREKLLKYAGKAKGLPKDAATPLTNLFREVSKGMPDLPKDLAAQHDHYLYGKPKR